METLRAGPEKHTLLDLLRIEISEYSFAVPKTIEPVVNRVKLVLILEFALVCMTPPP
jgi:hypothetical protein